MPPQAAINAPNGARKPSTFTDAAFCAEERPKVLTSMRLPQMIAANTPQAWMARCAGVQKVSRPIERCQETSHAPPIEAEVTASAPNHRYQGTRDPPDTTCATRGVE